MNYKKSQLSEKRKAFNKGLSELLDVLNDVASGNDNSTWTDNEGNKIKLDVDVEEDKAIVHLDIEQKNSNVYISIVKPVNQTLENLEHKKLLEL